MSWGMGEKQSHYLAGRQVNVIHKSQIEGVCACGYITMKPQDDFENHNGGLTVRKNSLTILDSNGRPVRRLRPRTINGRKEFNLYFRCNACVNDWR